MISHRHKFIFIHLIKCGGTTIENILGGVKSHRPGGHFIFKEDWVETTKNKVHVCASQYSKTFYWDGYFKFTFVRNPWDKMVSFYEYYRKLRNEPNIKFIDFLLDEHWKPMFYDQLTHLVSHNGKNEIDFIGKFENLQEDFNTICDKIKIPRHQLPHKNATNHKHYTEYYDDETKQIVAEKYAKDIEYFGYKFGE